MAVILLVLLLLAWAVGHSHCAPATAPALMSPLVAAIMAGMLAATAPWPATAEGGVLTMHHIASCSQCGRPEKGACPGSGCGSWCQLPPNCTKFVLDAMHVAGPPLAAIGCDKLPSCGLDRSWHGQPVAATYCIGFDLYAATSADVPPPTGGCPPTPPAPPAPPPAPVPIWHLPARCEEGDVNALFQWNGVWHLMQQWHARPATSVGHAVSQDLLHFDRLTDVLKSGATKDQQCYDGSSSITSRGPMLMIDGGCGFHTASPGEKPCMESSGHDTGGVTAWPVNLTDINLTRWKVQGPTTFRGCDGASGPSPNWRNPVTGKQQLVAINGSSGDALFEATDETLTSWVKTQPAFTPMRGGGGQLWHPLPLNVDGVITRPNYTHIIQIDQRGDGAPNFVLLNYDYVTSQASDFTTPVVLDTGSVAFGQLSNPGGTGPRGTPGDPRTIHVSWSPAANGVPRPPCGPAVVDVGQLTSFRDLRYDPRLGTVGRLVESPIAEYLSLRTGLLARGNVSLGNGKPGQQVLNIPPGPSAADIELSVTLDPGDASFSIGFACAGHTTTTSGCGGIVTMSVSGVAVTMGATTYPLLPGERERPFPLRVMLDTRSIEVFAHEGRAVWSGAISYAACAAGGCSVNAEAKSGAQIAAVAYSMKGIF